MSALQDKIKGNWNQMKGNLKQKWAELTDDELLYEEGKEDEMIGKIQKKTGESKEAINKFIEDMKFD
ncbi:MAG: CsbD family protein [Bacteroidetes bacterium 43-16]|nr:MAG: CsbD family protein [Bacteroidetes bacterium 43-16]